MEITGVQSIISLLPFIQKRDVNSPWMCSIYNFHSLLKQFDFSKYLPHSSQVLTTWLWISLPYRSWFLAGQGTPSTSRKRICYYSFGNHISILYSLWENFNLYEGYCITVLINLLLTSRWQAKLWHITTIIIHIALAGQIIWRANSGASSRAISSINSCWTCVWFEKKYLCSF